jgi:hypothetical protein
MASPHVRSSSLLHGLKWAGAPVVAVPAAVILHEIGHLIAYLIFGFGGATLHYSSATYNNENTFWQLISRGDFGAAAAINPIWQAGMATAAGLIATVLVAAVCCYVAAKYNPHPLVIALGFFTPFRFLSGLPVIFGALSGKTMRPSSDEGHIALLSGIPVVLLSAAGICVLIGVWYLLIKSIPRQQRPIAIGGLLTGTAIGFVLYFRFIGPWLLP